MPSSSSMRHHAPATNDAAAPRFLCSSWTQLAYFGEAIHRGGSRIGPRIQRYYELILLVEGDARVELGTKKFHLASGQMCLFRPAMRQAIHFEAAPKTHHVRCATLNPHLVSAPLADALRATADQIAITQRCSSLVDIGLSLPRLAGEQAQGLIESLAMATIQEYLFDAECSGAPPPAEPNPLRRALEWIGRTGASPVDIASLSREAGVSPTHLLRMFKQHMGTTPMHYVWEMRARRGVQLLRETELSVGEVAWRCGFQTPFHFSRWVKKLHGVSPAGIRQQARPQA
ncbi:MAG: helix-turn-helix transcriptional regulator [Opitutae bacterium]|nr:helix-turn-helix transcriptional regulator [Opitutae bacterium]